LLSAAALSASKNIGFKGASLTAVYADIMLALSLVAAFTARLSLVAANIPSKIRIQHRTEAIGCDEPRRRTHWRGVHAPFSEEVAFGRWPLWFQTAA
jgi:hypothetical protein